MADDEVRHVQLSMLDPDEMQIQLSVQRALDKQIMLTQNIYNAYLIKKYKWSERSRWESAPWFMRFYVSVLPYFIAVVQWFGVTVLILIQFYSYEGGPDNLKTFGLYPDEYWKQKLLMWPFFFVALSYTYSRGLACEVDIWSLKYEGVIVCDLSQQKCKCNMEVMFLKHLTEGFLNHWGGFIFYAILAGCSDYGQLGDLREMIFAILEYIFVFDLDEYAYLLVKDIFVFTFNDKTSSADPDTPFYGKAEFTVDGAKQAPLRILGVFLCSIAILGIFMRSYVMLGVFGGAWIVVEIIKMFIGGHEMSLWIKKRNS